MARPHKYTKAQMADALEKAHGLRTIAARALGCSPKTVHEYIERYPDLAEIVEFATVERFERAWLKLDEKIDRGEPWAIQTALRHELERERVKLAHAAGATPSDWRQYFERMGIDPTDALLTIRASLAGLVAKRIPSAQVVTQLPEIQAESVVQP